MPPRDDYSFPEDFPDLTIPERSDVPPPPAQPAARPTAAACRPGDRVLAPWEPDCLYAGRVAEVSGDQAMIQFDDGDAGWVPLSRVRPLAVPVRQKVFSRRRMGHVFFPGEVAAVDGDRVRVVFADGQEEWTTVAALRIPCQPGPGAQPVKVASHQAFQGSLSEGARVWAPWQGGVLYAGTVDRLRGEEAHIRFDDGDAGWVLRAQLLPLDIPVGARLLVRRRMGAQVYPGTVIAVQGERVHIQYEDGSQEWTGPAALCIPAQPTGPDARPTRSAYGQPGAGYNPYVRPRGPTGSGRGMGWLIFVVFWIILAFSRFACR
jgi:hypothetical protein